MQTDALHVEAVANIVEGIRTIEDEATKRRDKENKFEEGSLSAKMENLGGGGQPSRSEQSAQMGQNATEQGSAACNNN